MVPRADAERAVFVFGISLSKIDHHVFVKGSLASQIATEEVKGQGEQVLGILMEAAITPATGAIAPGADVIGKEEDDFIHCFLLSGEPLHRTHLCYFLFLPLFKDNLTSAVVLKKLSEVTNRVMETYFTWVDHKNLNGGQECGSREGSLPGAFCGERKHLLSANLCTANSRLSLWSEPPTINDPLLGKAGGAPGTLFLSKENVPSVPFKHITGNTLMSKP